MSLRESISSVDNWNLLMVNADMDCLTVTFLVLEEQVYFETVKLLFMRQTR